VQADVEMKEEKKSDADADADNDQADKTPILDKQQSTEKDEEAKGETKGEGKDDAAPAGEESKVAAPSSGIPDILKIDPEDQE